MSGAFARLNSLLIDWSDDMSSSAFGSLSDAVDATEAATAELVAAVNESRKALQAFADNGMPPNYFRHVAAEKRLDAALAAVGAA